MIWLFRKIEFCSHQPMFRPHHCHDFINFQAQYLLSDVDPRLTWTDGSIFFPRVNCRGLYYPIGWCLSVVIINVSLLRGMKISSHSLNLVPIISRFTRSRTGTYKQKNSTRAHKHTDGARNDNKPKAFTDPSGERS